MPKTIQEQLAFNRHHELMQAYREREWVRNYKFNKKNASKKLQRKSSDAVDKSQGAI
jgi:hypothetical protein